MSTTVVTPSDGNPFDAPLQSEIDEHSQVQQATIAKSSDGNPFDEPLASEKAEAQHDTAMKQTRYDGSKMGSKVPNSILNAPDSLGDAVGGLALGGGAAMLASETAAPALRYIASEWGAPAVKALQTAAEAHPLVAKVIAHGLAEAGVLSVAKYLKIFGK